MFFTLLPEIKDKTNALVFIIRDQYNNSKSFKLILDVMQLMSVELAQQIDKANVLILYLIRYFYYSYLSDFTNSFKIIINEDDILYLAKIKCSKYKQNN